MSSHTVSGATKRAAKAPPVIRWDALAGRVRLASDAEAYRLPAVRKGETGEEYGARVSRREDVISRRAERIAESLRDSGAPAEIVDAGKVAAMVARDVLMVSVGGVTVSATSRLGRALLAARRGLVA